MLWNKHILFLSDFIIITGFTILFPVHTLRSSLKSHASGFSLTIVVSASIICTLLEPDSTVTISCTIFAFFPIGILMEIQKLL